MKPQIRASRGRSIATAAIAGCPATTWAATGGGIDPTVFVLAILAAFAAGLAVGYAVAKASTK